MAKFSVGGRAICALSVSFTYNVSGTSALDPMFELFDAMQANKHDILLGLSTRRKSHHYLPLVVLHKRKEPIMCTSGTL